MLAGRLTASLTVTAPIDIRVRFSAGSEIRRSEDEGPIGS